MKSMLLAALGLGGLIAGLTLFAQKKAGKKNNHLSAPGTQPLTITRGAHAMG